MQQYYIRPRNKMYKILRFQQVLNNSVLVPSIDIPGNLRISAVVWLKLSFYCVLLRIAKRGRKKTVSRNAGDGVHKVDKK